MPWSRVMGLRSIYAKTVRDSRRAALLVGGMGGLFMLATGAPYGVEFGTMALRQTFLAGMTALPAARRGLLGEPIHIETLGGFISWRVGNSLPVILGLWSVLALSGTLAGEAAKGSLDLLAATPVSRRAMALQKLAGHMTALTVAMVIFAVITWITGVAFAVLPGDDIPFGAAVGQALLYGLLMLAAGSLSFAVAPFVGRTRALAFGLIALFGGYLINSYASLSPAIDALRPLSWYAWTAGHRPLAGVSDWPSVGLLAVVTAAFLAIGIVAFERRDLGDYTALRWLRLPSLPAGTGNPFTRQLADRAGIAIAWGVGVGLYAVLIIASADAFAKSIASIPQIAALIKSIYPDIDLQQPSGLLQLTFFAFGSFILGLAGASFLGGWSSDEGRRRLDLVLAAPLSRARWFIQSGLGAYAAIGVMTLVLAAFVGVGVATQAGDVIPPMLGVGVLGLATAAFAGVGLAAGGLVRPSLAAPVAAGLVIATFLLDTLGEALDLPDVVLDLSLYRHLGQPMAGAFDPIGIVAATVLAVGGLAVGAWGLRRRDLDR
ncbi:MAG: polyether ionophore transport system permease protein [Chloroflexota bacterium]|nr:polyether ionophore transport system permease protein [Chloroflexota bacterium]